MSMRKEEASEMNSLLNIPSLEKEAIEILAQGRKRADGTPKDIDHSLRVRSQALKIASLLNHQPKINRTVIETSALLHDIGWSFIPFQDKSWIVGAHAGAGAYKAFDLVLKHGGNLEQAFAVKDIIQLHDFDVAWEGHPRELEIVHQFFQTVTPEAYCVIAADKGDRFENVEAYLEIFKNENVEFTRQKLTRLLRLAEIWFREEKVRLLYQESINQIKSRLEQIKS